MFLSAQHALTVLTKLGTAKSFKNTNQYKSSYQLKSAEVDIGNDAVPHLINDDSVGKFGFCLVDY